jgi:putative membrane protein
MPTLTLPVAFVFPQTNQTDPLPQFKAGLEQLYDGVKQLNTGIGDPAKTDTLLYGITQIDSGLQKMASAQEGLPYAKSNIDSQMIPGVQQAAAGIGSETTPDTLLYADASVKGGLEAFLTGIGNPTASNTLLYAMAQMNQGLGTMKEGIGSTGASDTLMYAMDQMNQGLETMKEGIGSTGDIDTLLYAVAQVQAGLNTMLLGANTMIAGIGSAATPGTLLNGLAQVLGGIQNMSAGLGAVGQPGTIIDGLNTMATNLNPANPAGIYAAVAGVSALLKAGGGGLYDYVNGIPVTDPSWSGYLATINSMLAGYTGFLDPAAGGIQNIYNGLAAALPNGIIANLQFAKSMMDGALIPGINQIVDGLDNLNPATPGIKQGLQQIAAGIGSSGAAGTLLYAMAAMQLGLQQMKQGIGDKSTSGSLLYGVTAVEGGLLNMAKGIGSSSSQDTLLYAVNAVEQGLNTMKEGIGNAGVSDTMLYAMAAMQMGLQQIKSGMSTGDPNNPGLVEGLVILSAGLSDAIAGLGSATTPDTLLYGTSQVSSGLTQMGGGTSQMQEGLMTNLGQLNLTQAELEAIKIRGDEYDHFLGRAENANNQVRFIFQTKPTYAYTQGSKSSWIVAIILSIIIALALVLGGIFLARRFMTA